LAGEGLANVGRGLPIDLYTIMQEGDSGNAPDPVGCTAWQLARERQLRSFRCAQGHNLEGLVAISFGTLRTTFPRAQQTSILLSQLTEQEVSVVLSDPVVVVPIQSPRRLGKGCQPPKRCVSWSP
jgi:hypothetical protein